MKQGRSLTELAQELERQRTMKHDYKAPTEQIVFEPQLRDDSKQQKPNVKVNLPGINSFQPTPLFHDQIGTWAGIPAKYYDRMLAEAPGLLSQNMNYWLHTKTETRLVRTLNGNARAFLSNRYRPIDNDLVAEAALETLIGQGSDLRIESCEVTDTRLYIKAVSSRIEAKVKGDVVQAGIVVSNSEVGLHSVRVEPLVLILACINGAIMPESGMRRYHVGRHVDDADAAFEVFTDATRQADDKALMMKLRDVVRASFDEPRFRELASTLDIVAGNKITRASSEVIDKVVEVFSLPETSGGRILEELARKGDYTQWGLSNAVTAHAQDAALTYEDATQLERIGGKILTLPNDQWHAIAA